MEGFHQARFAARGVVTMEHPFADRFVKGPDRNQNGLLRPGDVAALESLPHTFHSGARPTAHDAVLKALAFRAADALDR